jgi:NADPH-dependent glutamate synthase beta subunit-like oxidoreductase
MTSMAGIFAGGDLVRGPTTALHAVRDARRAAVGIHQFCAEITRTHFIAAKGG